MASEKGFYKLNGTKMRGTLHGNRLKRFLVWDPEEVRLEGRMNESNCNIEEVPVEEGAPEVEEEAPEEEAVA